MQFLVKLDCYINVMFSPVVMAAGLLLWKRTTAESKHYSHQTRGEWGNERRMSWFPTAEVAWSKRSAKGGASQIKQICKTGKKAL